MIHYNVWFNFRSDVGDTEGLAVVHDFLRELHTAGAVAGFQLLKNSGSAAKTNMLSFQALIEFCDDSQFSAAFSAQAARGIHTGLHGRILSVVEKFQIEVFRRVAVGDWKTAERLNEQRPYPRVPG